MNRYAVTVKREREKMQTVYLDTETTGLRGIHAGGSDEIVEIAICDDDGVALVDSLVRPTTKTDWPDAERINKIAPATVADAPTLEDLLPVIRAAVEGRRVVIYNAAFDVQFFPDTVFETSKIACCMLRYAEHAGVWDDYRAAWKWHKLISAAERIGYKPDGDFHRALADTLATRAVWNWLNLHDRKIRKSKTRLVEFANSATR